SDLRDAGRAWVARRVHQRDVLADGELPVRPPVVDLHLDFRLPVAEPDDGDLDGVRAGAGDASLAARAPAAPLDVDPGHHPLGVTAVGFESVDVHQPPDGEPEKARAEEGGDQDDDAGDPRDAGTRPPEPGRCWSWLPPGEIRHPAAVPGPRPSASGGRTSD